MTLLPVLAALFVSPVAVALVYADAGRRDLSSRYRAVAAATVGVASFGGFLAAAVFGSGLLSAYRRLLDQPAVAVTPLEFLLSLLLFGLVGTALAVLGYGVASRFGPLAPR
ncbi:hypothetical protein BVU17_12845 [Haloarcula taiwanensis]|uniref:Uncharacterized protein n=1 Tax=Haloarcula taiwanensis TaxID=1932004 RepID=A0A2H5A0V6_9EURY|nr:MULTISPECIES: hypothetical protein [Haloarcula]AUG48369.1 hypothetical protein BVU17_12845 [Haloarcula taiwanensis]RLM39725.1 hypothetical protein DVK01_03955 [Haloarcula sp. Atlit-120R]RLM47699.1 hypothetical protein DVK00_04110 [Haloarcula sp. Atlit-47R]RLM97087.1 hypothetical protein D3D01_04585 [Haloarcula sp. Atlit-7R]